MGFETFTRDPLVFRTGKPAGRCGILAVGGKVGDEILEAQYQVEQICEFREAGRLTRRWVWWRI